MQRILQPGEIEALDRVNFPRVQLPEVASLLPDRANRLRQLANGHPLGDYLRFVARLVDAQQQALRALGDVVPLPGIAGEASLDRAWSHAMSLAAAEEFIGPVWQQALNRLLTELGVTGGDVGSDAAGDLPAPLRRGLVRLAAMPPAQRADLLRGLLVEPGSEEGADEKADDADNSPDTARLLAPVLMAALQVVGLQVTRGLSAEQLPIVSPATVCPVCSSAPVASLIRIGGAVAGRRYLQCSVCATEWHCVRVKCTHCESTAGIGYLGIESGGLATGSDVGAGASATPGGVVVAETCDTCSTYRKVVSQEKDPFAEPLADDLASVMLDLLMNDTPFARASGNPLLAFGDD